MKSATENVTMEWKQMKLRIDIRMEMKRDRCLNTGAENIIKNKHVEMRYNVLLGIDMRQ